MELDPKTSELTSENRVYDRDIGVSSPVTSVELISLDDSGNICNSGLQNHPKEKEANVSEPKITDHNGVSPSELNFEEVPLSKVYKEKIADVEATLTETPTNYPKFKKFALSDGGLINDEIRRKVWPKLLGLNSHSAAKPPSQEELESHGEYRQVVLDVNRSLKRFPPGIPYEQRVALQDQLTRLILRVIMKYPHLRYYQGYHDVAVTFLLVVGEADAFQIMEVLSTNHLKECMEPTMEKTSRLLHYIYPLIQRLHPNLYEYMEKSGVGTMFCLPWYLTWYGHSLNQYRDVVRLYDYFLASEPLLPLYLAATLVVYRKDEIFSVDCDMASIHSLLSQIPDDLPFEKLLKEATTLYENYPPNSIEAEVNQRCNKEFQLRRPDGANSGAHKPSRTNILLWQWLPLQRYIPAWAIVPNVAPRIHYRFLLVTATLVGLYAYVRLAEAVDINSVLPVR